jgi:hypothetical protein
MAISQLPPVYDEFLDFLLEKATPQEILAYHASEKAQERAIELLEKGSFEELTPEELIELEQMRTIDQIISVLKARALEALSKS